MIGAFVFSELWVTHHVALGLALVAAIALSAALAAATEVVLVRPLRGQPPLQVMVGTLAVAALLLTYAGRRWGVHPHFLPPLINGAGLRFAGLAVSPTQLLIALVSLLSIGGLALVYRYSSFGLRLRATAIDPTAAGLIGIDTNRTSVATWAIAGALAGISAILIAPSVAFSVFFMTS